MLPVCDFYACSPAFRRRRREQPPKGGTTNRGRLRRAMAFHTIRVKDRVQLKVFMTLSDQIILPTALLAMGGSAAAFLAWSIFMPSSNVFGPILCKLPNASAVALSFDDGPTESTTAQILDILGEHHACATFFVIGRNVQSAPKLVRRMADEGHTIGNHSWDHHHFGICSSRSYWHDQIEHTNQIVFDTAGVRPTLFRPPMGFKTWHMAVAAKELHMQLVGWSLRVFDTRDLSSETIGGRITNRLRGGQIIMLHDGVEPARAQASQQATVNALPAILQHVRSRNLALVTLGSALQSPSPEVMPA